MTKSTLSALQQNEQKRTAKPLCAAVALRGESSERFRSGLEVKMRVIGTPFVQANGAVWASCRCQISVDGHLGFADTAQNCWLCPFVTGPSSHLVICLFLVTEVARIVPKTALELYGYHIYVGVVVNAAGFVVYDPAEDPHGSGLAYFTRRTSMSWKARCAATAATDATASFTISPG